MSRAYICNGWYIGYEGQLMSIHIILYFFFSRFLAFMAAEFNICH